MENLTDAEKREIAGLRSYQGYFGLIEKVIKPRREAALAKVKSSKRAIERSEAGLEWSIWDDVVKLLDDTPRNLAEELKEQGDFVYG